MSAPTPAVTMPTVSYDPEKFLIAIGVIVSLPAGSTRISIEVAPVTVPRGTWTLIWSLVVATPGIRASFNGQGIYPPALPGSAAAVLPPSIGDEERSVQIENPGVLQEYQYEVAVDWSRDTSPTIVTERIHDPTIALVEEPIG